MWDGNIYRFVSSLYEMTEFLAKLSFKKANKRTVILLRILQTVFVVVRSCFYDSCFYITHYMYIHSILFTIFCLAELDTFNTATKLD